MLELPTEPSALGQAAALWDCELSGHHAITWDRSLSAKVFIVLLESNLKEPPGHSSGSAVRHWWELYKNTDGQ